MTTEGTVTVAANAFTRADLAKLIERIADKPDYQTAA